MTGIKSVQKAGLLLVTLVLVFGFIVQETAGQTTGGTIRQWASTAIAGSEYSSTGWSATQATGAPDTFTYGDIQTAWAPLRTDDSIQWIELKYSTYVYAIGVNVYETYNPGALSKIDLRDSSGVYHTVWAGTDNNTGIPDKVGWSNVTFAETTYLTNTVKLYLDTNLVAGWNEIDAVELVGASTTISGKGDLNNNGVSADAGDLVLMKRASIGEIQADSRYDLNNNGQPADAGDLVLMKRASIGEIILQNNDCNTENLSIPLTGMQSSIWDDGTVSLSIPLENQGNASALDISILNIQAQNATYLGPTPFPYPAGTIVAGGTEQLYAEFMMAPLLANSKYSLIVTGSYNSGATVCTFQAQTFVMPPPPGNGGAPKSTTALQTFTADTAFYPTEPLFHSPDDQPNAEQQFLPPLGQPRNLFTTPPPLSVLNKLLAFNPNDQTPPSSSSPNDVVFVRNQKGGTYNGLPPDPNAAGATPSGFVMISANTAVSYSKDYGKTFTTVSLTRATGFSDPARPGRIDFFPESDGGLCCDQVVHYIPGTNLMIWLLQYWSPNINVGGIAQKGQNRLRIAWATPQAAAADFLHAWSWFDVSPTTLGDTTVTDWMDYPDLAYSNDWLYISVDHGFWNSLSDAKGNVIGQQVYSNRRWFVRASLNDMAGSAGTINLVYYEPIKNGLAKAHFVQSAPDTMYYAAEPDTSKLSVFADPDSSPNTPTPKDIGVTSYCKATATKPCDYSVTAPDNPDWTVRVPHGVLGGTYVAPSFFCPPEGCAGPTHFLYFAFDGGRDSSNGRPYPYVRVEKIDADALNLISEMDIWNPNFAFAMPALVWRPPSVSGTRKDEVAFSLATGGGGNYADNAVGFLGDFVAYVTTSSNGTQCCQNGNARYGDYFSVRNAAVGPVTPDGQGVGYATLGYAVTQATPGSTCVVGCNVALQYVLFGRNADMFPKPPPIIR